MTQNAATASNVTSFTQSKGNFSEAVDLLHEAEIAGGDFRHPALGLAGPLMSEVGNVFQQNFILIYLVSSYKKRQVWNSWLAKMFCADPANPRPIVDPSAIRHKLMRTRSADLLVEAYGAIPDGFISALGRLGLEGQQPEIYILLHKFMSESLELRKSFSHASVIKASTVTTLAKLPLAIQTYELADQIIDPSDIKTLTFIIDTLARGDATKYSEICSNVVKAAKHGNSISGVLKRYYYQVKFPDPIVLDTEFCKHICNAFELKKAAKQFQNCLGDYCEEGIRGEYVYYRIFENNRPVAVVSLRNDHPFGWRIYDIKGKKNEYIDDVLEMKIIKHFEQHGIYKQPAMEGLLNNLSGVFKNEHRIDDPTQHINNIIDGLLDEGNQI